MGESTNPMNPTGTPGAGYGYTSGASDLGDEENRTPEEIRQNIEQTRSEMDETVQEIRNRLSPRYMAESAVGGVRDMVRRDSDKVIDAIRRNPMPLALISLGIGWIVYNQSETVHQKVNRVGHDVGEKARAAGSRIGEKAHQAKETLSDKAHQAKETLSDKAHQAKEKLSDKASEMMERRRRTKREKSGLDLGSYSEGGSVSFSESDEFETDEMALGGMEASEAVTSTEDLEFAEGIKSGLAEARGKIANVAQGARQKVSSAASAVGSAASTVGVKSREMAHRTKEGVLQAWDSNPLAIGAVALALGTAVGLALPRTHVEDEYLGPRSDELKSRARETGEEAVNRLKSVAERTMETAKEDIKQEYDEALASRQAEEGYIAGGGTTGKSSYGTPGNQPEPGSML